MTAPRSDTPAGRALLDAWKGRTPEPHGGVRGERQRAQRAEAENRPVPHAAPATPPHPVREENANPTPTPIGAKQTEKQADTGQSSYLADTRAARPAAANSEDGPNQSNLDRRSEMATRKVSPFAKRECARCGALFTPKSKSHKYCSKNCGSPPLAESTYEAPSNSAKGAASELIVAVDLMGRGFHVFRCVSHAAPFDIIAYRSDLTLKIEVKTARQFSGTDEWILTPPRLNEHDVIAHVLIDDREIRYFPPPEEWGGEDPFTGDDRPLPRLYFTRGVPPDERAAVTKHFRAHPLPTGGALLYTPAPETR